MIANRRFFSTRVVCTLIAIGLVVCGLVLPSFLPIAWRPRLTRTGQLDHFIAYTFVAATLAILLVPKVLSSFALGLSLTIVAIAAEIAQLWSVDRTARVIDALAGIAGILAGLLVAHALFVALRNVLPIRKGQVPANRNGSVTPKPNLT